MQSVFCGKFSGNILTPALAGIEPRLAGALGATDD
jgi:hypothetical protein